MNTASTMPATLPTILSLDAQYHAAPDASFDALMNDAGCFQSTAADIVRLAAAESETLDEARMSNVLFGACYLLDMAHGVIEVARQQTPRPVPHNLPAVTRSALNKALHALEGRWPRHFDAESQRDHEAINAIREVLAAMGDPKAAASDAAAGERQA